MDRPVINFSVELYFRIKCMISASHRAGSPPPPPLANQGNMSGKTRGWIGGDGLDSLHS